MTPIGKLLLFYYVPLVMLWMKMIAAENATYSPQGVDASCTCEKGEFCFCNGKLTITELPIQVLLKTSITPFSNELEELTLEDLENFEHFEPGVFVGLEHLQTIYIKNAPKLVAIDPRVFGIILPPQLKTLRIVNTGLQEVPEITHHRTENILDMVELESNHIKKISSNQITNLQTGHLILDYNDLETIEAEAFSGSKIAKLSLKGNFRLTNLHRRAFAGIQELREIDLSSTAITFLPTEGLSNIEVLIVEDTETLKVFPSVYNFKNIKKANLTYPYHCCAFKFPQTHNPREYDKHKKELEQFQRACSNATVSNHTVKAAESNDEMDIGVFHDYELKSNDINRTTFAICGNFSFNYHAVKCIPSPDAFNPCEDIMGNWMLRNPVWFISLSAIIGNLFVIVVIATSHFRLSVSKFLMCNLAVADLCIGVHLFLIAIVDACSIGVYFNYAIDWQEGNGCKVAGFLTIFGNVLSVYTLAVITTERWYTITWAIHLNKRLKLRTAVQIMFAGWVCAIFMASLPLVGISSYSKTSICLPLENKGKADAIYLSTLLAFNAVAFALIVVCYGSMYKSIIEGGNTCSITCVRCDLTVAKRMALLVFTDFACWAPIAFFGMTALLGHPLINVTQTKILLVFFYPLNSCANPYLYALLTQQYRRDFFILMGRYGLCKDRAERHKGAIGGKPLPYGTGAAYKRNIADHGKNTNSGSSHRGSVLTTIVSVEAPISRTTSRHNTRHRHNNINASPAYSLKNINNYDIRNTNDFDLHGDRHRHTSTENL